MGGVARMNIELNLTLFGVRLHVCTGVAKIDGDDGPEVVELSAQTERVVGFQPNEEREDEDE
jgi:hypothetical protein